uniref:Uncharacterized protein n=1 Tax=Rhizophora mucronata TaxID=61149 RepID=A0A2P2PDW7_RHIMU
MSGSKTCTHRHSVPCPPFSLHKYQHRRLCRDRPTK